MKFWSGYCAEGLSPKENDIKYVNVRENPFRIHGIYNLSDDNFRRLPTDFANSVSGGVATHAKSSAGVRVRFATDSPYIVIKATLKDFVPSPHVTYSASKGFDLYTEEDGEFIYHNTFLPPLDLENNVVGITYLSGNKIKNIIVDFPIGTEVSEVLIGVKSGCKILKPDNYLIKKPIVFYGSSITQGFAASRPGNIYENFISRAINADYYNFGFSGSALGEESLAEYLSKIPMSAFVLDYDYNAPDVEHLQKTHQHFYRIIRDNNSNIPIVIVSRPDRKNGKNQIECRKIIKRTYLKAKSNGDSNVYFINGATLFPKNLPFDCTADGCHPNDIGMASMAKVIGKVLKNALK